MRIEPEAAQCVADWPRVDKVGKRVSIPLLKQLSELRYQRLASFYLCNVIRLWHVLPSGAFLHHPILAELRHKGQFKLL